MSKEQKITNNIKVPNKDLETLKIHFPHCFDKDGNFQLEKFKNNLTEKEVSFSTESYGLDWLGKSYARLLASDPATTLLKADETHNAKPENANSENLLIKGDNLEVLKHLANAYYEKIKMIYIDPPYNTGSDGFVYNDDRKFTVKELQNLIGIDEERAKRILDFTQSKSNSHSAWLTFMYPRLYIAKQLLRDDGVIFVSIDDNEVAQLRLLMDEIFGEENFVAELIWKSKSGGANDSRFFAIDNEYIICYSKKASNLSFNKDKNGTVTTTYNLEDEKGRYALDRLDKQSIRYSESGNYEIKDSEGKSYFPAHKDPENPNATWRWGKDTVKERFDELVFKDGFVYTKNYEKDGTLPRNLLLDERFGRTRTGKTEFSDLFGSAYFTAPKPSKLIKFLLDISTSDNDIILDFFAGSGTTGDAVMQLNADPSAGSGYGNRKFILVQLPEPIDPKKNKTAYDFVKNELKAEPTIFEITKERLIRAANKINRELDEKNKKIELRIADLESQLPTDETKAEIKTLRKQMVQNEKLKAQNTFKIFETMPIWENYHFEAEDFTPEAELFDESQLTDDDLKSLLVTWKTYDGIPLTEDLMPVDLPLDKGQNKHYRAYYGSEKLYLMNRGFTTETLKALLEKIDSDKDFDPKSVIAFGYYFESKNLRELAESVKHFNNKKNLDIDFIVRY